MSAKRTPEENLYIGSLLAYPFVLIASSRFLSFRVTERSSLSSPLVTAHASSSPLSQRFRAGLMFALAVCRQCGGASHGTCPFACRLSTHAPPQPRGPGWVLGRGGWRAQLVH